MITKIFNFQFSIFNSKKRELGFTLIELLVVIAIIGILSSFLFANFVGVRQRARDGVRKSDLRQIQSALELYRSDKSEYPDPDDLLLLPCGSSFEDDSAPPVVYMRSIPCDPLNEEPYYIYKYSLDGAGYNLAACLENTKDSQRDQSNNPTDISECDGSNNWSHTLQNP